MSIGMIFKFRVILDAEGEVFRDLETESKESLESLHILIVKSFGFDGAEPSAFYMSDENWGQGREIPLLNFDGTTTPMSDFLMDKILKKGSRMIYVYDFISMWTFYVELMDIYTPKDGHKYPNICFSNGQLPETPPDKFFKSVTPDVDFEIGYDSLEDSEEDYEHE